jgi:hypothetical protein
MYGRSFHEYAKPTIHPRGTASSRYISILSPTLSVPHCPCFSYRVFFPSRQSDHRVHFPAMQQKGHGGGRPGGGLTGRAGLFGLLLAHAHVGQHVLAVLTAMAGTMTGGLT